MLEGSNDLRQLYIGEDPSRTCPSIPCRPHADATAPRAADVDSRTFELLRGAIVPTLLRLAWPNIIVMLAQASTGLIETWWVSRLGVDALAGMGAGFPRLLVVPMPSGRGVGGGHPFALPPRAGRGSPDHPDPPSRSAV